MARFSELFAEDEDGIPRNWAPKISIPSVTSEARQGAAQVMALLAANRLDRTPVLPICMLPAAGICSFMLLRLLVLQMCKEAAMCT